MTDQLAKVLRPNDIGATGTHQAGIHIPKRPEALGFFPHLDPSVRNPDAWIELRDDLGNALRLRYVYYNGRLHGDGTRNEYRITHIVPWLKSRSARPGDEIVFTRTASARVFGIRLHSLAQQISSPMGIEPTGVGAPKSSLTTQDVKTVLKLGSGWSIIKL